MDAVEAMVVSVPTAAVDGAPNDAALLNVACVNDLATALDLLAARVGGVSLVVDGTMYVMDSVTSTGEIDLGHALIVPLSV